MKEMRFSRGFGAMACLDGSSMTWTVGPPATDTLDFEGNKPVAPVGKGVLAHRVNHITDNDLWGGSE